MAKKKSPAPNGAKTSNGANSKTSVKSNGRQSATSVKAPASKSAATSTAVGMPELSNEQIGQVAGQVWHQLADSNGQSLVSLKKSIDAPADLVVAALGWLAREGKLKFAISGRTLKITLR